MKSLKLFLFIFLIWSVASPATAEFIYRDGTTQGNGWRKRIDEAAGLKIMWWNLGCKKSHRVRTNLKALAAQRQGIRPDVLILGEYCGGKLEEESGLLDDLLAVYPHVYKVSQYTQYHGQNGLRVFSHFAIRDMRKQIVDPGSWLGEMKKQSCYNNKSKNSSDFKKARYEFPLLKFKVKKGNKVYKIAGAHAPNPWPVMTRCIGKAKAGLKMVYGTENPTYRYANAIVNAYKTNNQAIVIGDFNSPKKLKVSILTLMGNAYKRLSALLGASVVNSNQPTAFSPMGNHSIDHAFVSDDLKVRFAEVIKLGGSDHVPIYIVVK